MGDSWGAEPMAQPFPENAGETPFDRVPGRNTGTAAKGKGVRPQPAQRRSLVGRIVLAVVLAVVVACIAFVAFLAWDRWWAYDDAADMQGIWQANGSASTVVIDGERIQLTDDVSYAYEIDPFAKTITFNLGNMEGEGRYRFSPDRKQLVITDGPNYSWLSTLMDDIPWRVQTLQDELAGAGSVGKETASGEEDGRTILDRS